MDAMQTDFVRSILPAVDRRARFVIPFKPGTDRFEEILQTASALAWSAYRDLVRRGDSRKIFPTAIARFAVGQAMAQRDVARSINTAEPLAKEAQVKRGVERVHLDAGVWDRRESVVDRAAFRVDFPMWLATLRANVRQVANLLAAGHRTLDVARRMGVTPGRISMIRRELARSWDQFHGVPSTPA